MIRTTNFAFYPFTSCKDTKVKPQPRYNVVIGVQANVRVSYPNQAISRVKCMVIYNIGKSVFYYHLESLLYPVILAIERSRCIENINQTYYDHDVCGLTSENCYLTTHINLTDSCQSSIKTITFMQNSYHTFPEI